jgi:hypothetical protein
VLAAKIELNSAEDGGCWFVGKTFPLAHQELGTEKKQPVPTLFIYQRGHAYPALERMMKPWPNSLRSLIARLNGFHQARINPRSLEYMKEAIKRRVGDVGSPEPHDLSVPPKWGEFGQIILLWPDGNGLGWFNVERQMFGRANANAGVYVLNGRNRLFELRRTLWRRYRIRRFLEKSFLLEFGVLGVFLVTAPALALWDMTRDAMERGK